MKYCKDCWNFDRCRATGRTVDFPVDDGVCIHFNGCEPMTNADRIRAMSDEELANVISCPQEFFGLMGCPDVSDCTDCKQKWLQQPAEVE